MSHLGDRLTAYVDGELDHRTREMVASHLTRCPGCRQEMAAERRTKLALAGLADPAVQASPQLHARLLAVAAAPAPAPAPAGSRRPAPARPGRPAPGRGRVRASRGPGQAIRRVTRRRSSVLALGVLTMLGVGGPLVAGQASGLADADQPAVTATAVDRSSLAPSGVGIATIPLHASGVSFVSTVAITSGLAPAGR